MQDTQSANAIRGTASGIRKGAQAGASIVRGTVKKANFITRHPKGALFLGLGMLVVILVILVSGMSSSQMGSTFYLTAQNEKTMNMPEEEKRQDAIWSKENALEDTSRLIAVMARIKEKDRELAKRKIKEELAGIGLDSEEIAKSMGFLKEEIPASYVMESGITGASGNPGSDKNKSVNYARKEGKEKGILQTFDLSGLSEKNRTYFSYESYLTDWTEGTVQNRIFQSGNVYLDAYGFAKYKNWDGTEDYIIALGSYFGQTGNRYRITFENGTSRTFLKGDAKANQDTDAYGRCDKNNGSVIEFLVDPGKLNAEARYRGNCYYSTNGLFASPIKKIERIEGGVAVNMAAGAASSDLRILSAFSVSLANSQLIKKEGAGGEILSHITSAFEYVGDAYEDQKGNRIGVIWFGDQAGQIDYEKQLTDQLEGFRKENSFYRYFFETDAVGNIKRYPYKVTKTKEVQNEETGEMEIVTEEMEKHYVVPILQEKDISEILYDLFETKPEEDYVNSGGACTVREAINTLAKETQEVLYKSAGTGSVLIDGYSGEFAWPVPGVYHIESYFGYRIAPTQGASENHGGVDIASPLGSPVVAVEDGTVLLAEGFGNYGNCIMIQHEDGIQSVYGHLGAIYVSRGETVVKGQQIAASGNTGISTGPHLHLEIKVCGTPVNPLNFVAGKQMAAELL